MLAFLKTLKGGMYRTVSSPISVAHHSWFVVVDASSDITIDDDNLARLPENGVLEVPVVEVDDGDDEEEDAG